MAIGRQRMLPPDLLLDEQLMELEPAVFKTAIGLRMHADDHGRQALNLRIILGQVWPTSDVVTTEVLEDHLLELDAVGYILTYTVEGRNFYAMATWPSVSHASPSTLPAPPLESFRSRSGGSPESFSAGEGEGERGWGEGGAESPAGVPPSPFCKLHQPNGTRANCRHCGTARLAHEQWLYEFTGKPPRPDDEQE